MLVVDLKFFVILSNSEQVENIEMNVLSGASEQHHSFTPPVQCSSRNSMSEGNNSRTGSGRKSHTPADSMEYINRLVKDDIRQQSSRGSLHGK